MTGIPTDINGILDEIIDYYMDQRGDAGFRFSRKWVDECVDERAYYYQLDTKPKRKLSSITHSFFREHFQQYNKTHSRVTQYLEA